MTDPTQATPRGRRHGGARRTRLGATGPTAAFAVVVIGLATAFAVLASVELAAATPTIRVETDVQERHYDVYGANADQVFASIQRQNLGGRAGLSASGLTRSELSYTLSTQSSPEACRLLELELRAKVVVTLPRHAHPEQLDADSGREWSAYEAQVEFHEYRHVEIEFQGLQELQERLERDLPEESPDGGCTAWIDRAIAEQNETTRRRQEEFHREESVAVREAQARLRGEIETIDAKLRRDREEVRGLDATAADLAAQRGGFVQSIEAMIERYGTALPDPAYTRARELEQAIDSVTEDMDALLARRNSLAARYDDRLARRRRLAERLSWTR